MFFFEIVSFMIVWPIVWWLGGRLARDGERPAPPREPLPDNVVDLASYRRAREAEAGGASRARGR
jgi:hypothetical protein